jgi:hypothetical protein
MYILRKKQMCITTWKSEEFGLLVRILRICMLGYSSLISQTFSFWAGCQVLSMKEEPVLETFLKDGEAAAKQILHAVTWAS